MGKLVIEKKRLYLKSKTTKLQEDNNGYSILGEGNQVIIKEEDVERVLKISKGNKAPEPGGVPKELLGYGGKNVITFLMDRFNEILMGGNKLQEWNSAYVCCVHKKGDEKD